MSRAWREQASCLGQSPEIWFPEFLTPEAIAIAKGICAECPVKADCLDEALANVELEGIWGGETPSKRRNMRRRERSRAWMETGVRPA